MMSRRDVRHARFRGHSGTLALSSTAPENPVREHCTAMQQEDGPLIRIAVLSNLLADALGEVDLAQRNSPSNCGTCGAAPKKSWRRSNR
jgi:hypothetical protein